MNNEEALAKAVTARGAGGLADDLGDPSASVQLTQAESNFIIDQVVDVSVFLQDIRTVRMTRSRMEVPKLFVGDRIMRATNAGGTPESTDPGTDVDVQHTVVTLDTAKTHVPWTISEEYFEDVSDPNVERKIAEMMATQAGNDLEDLALNGDTTSSDALLWANDGFMKILNNTGQVYDWAGANWTRNAFSQAIRALPPKYRRNLGQLRFWVGSNLYQDFTDSVAARIGNTGDSYLLNGPVDPSFSNIPIRQVPVMAEDITAASRSLTGADNLTDIILSHPNNLIFGVQRDMKLRQAAVGKNAIRLDERYYVLHLRTDFAVQNPEAAVVVRNVRPRVAD